MPRLVYLKVKIKSLAAEARIIRGEEARRKNKWRLRRRNETNYDVDERQVEEYNGLRAHRTLDVRAEARAALLAYGLLRGKAYKQIEGEKTDKKLDEKRVLEIAGKYGRFASAVQLPASKEGALIFLRDWVNGKPLA